MQSLLRSVVAAGCFFFSCIFAKALKLQDAIQHPSNTKDYHLSNPDSILNSAAGQDNAVLRVLRAKENGFFVEYPARDGEHLSNTLALEKTFGWTGLLVEPDPALYQQILSKHRRAFTLNGCIGARNTSRFAREISSVQCWTIQDLFHALGRDHVDYLSLDSKGGTEILKSVDFEKVKIDVMTVGFRVEGNETASVQNLKAIRGGVERTGLYYEYGVLVQTIQTGIVGKDVMFARKDVE
jgi:hypothetical protein